MVVFILTARTTQSSARQVKYSFVAVTAYTSSILHDEKRLTHQSGSSTVEAAVDHGFRRAGRMKRKLFVKLFHEGTRLR